VLRPDLQKFIGIPYRDGGRNMSGADCGGLALLVLRAYGLAVPDFACATQAELPEILQQVSSSGRLLPLAFPEEPCLVCLATCPKAPRVVNHVGIYTGDGNMLHTRRGRVSHLVRLSSPCVAHTVRGYYRVC